MPRPVTMDPSSGRRESDIYLMDSAYAYDDPSAASSEEEFAEEEMIDNDGDDLADAGRSLPQSLMMDKTPQTSNLRPPPISTDWGASSEGDRDGSGQEEVEVVVDDRGTINNTRVSFAVPEKSDKEAPAAASMMHFRNPKRQNDNFASPYPTQSLRQTGSAADSALEELVSGGGGRIHIGLTNKTPNHPTRSGRPAPLEEVTPAFLRRAAQDLGVANNNNNLQDPVPPNSLMNRRQASSGSSNNLGSLPDSSFIGADASALDGTFVSIRDLNDDDDVPSVDNDQWTSPSRKEGSDADFPTETTSLLGSRKQMSWQGGFFGSQMEKEDRRERRRMMRARRVNWVTETIWAIGSLFSGPQKNAGRIDHLYANGWEANHPIGNDFISHRNAHTSSGGLARQRLFSLFLIGALCFHMALCGVHDLWLRYLSYRNPYDDEEAGVNWNGEGQYVPPYWTSFDGRVLNPLAGPGARTLTAFGALVPGLVLSKGQGWRAVTSMFQPSSYVQLILHIWALKTSVGSSLTGLEWKRGTITVVPLFLISALVGSAWSIAVEPGRLVTSSSMGISGLLAAAFVERTCFPLEGKDDEDQAVMSNPNDHGVGSNGVSSSSNEQFSFQPPNSHRKKIRNPLNSSSPALLLLLEILLSWWAAYTSLPGTATAAVAGGAVALLLFVGRPPPGSERDANHDLLLSETSPPPPPPKFAGGDSPNWRSDDDSTDTSFGAGRQDFATPAMRRSILADEDDEEEPLGTRSSLRKRYVNNGASAKTPVRNGRAVSIKNKQPFSASRVIARVVGIILALLLTLIPASLIATGEGPTNEVTRASVLGCRPMRILYQEDSNVFECAGGCVPLSRERIARKSEGMHPGRCDAIGYRCFQQSGSLTLRNYELNIGIYVVPSGDGSCGDAAEDDGDVNRNNDDANIEAGDANNGEAEGVQ